MDTASAFAKFKNDFAANEDVNSLQEQLMALKVRGFALFLSS
jgi:hypothetical protein